MGEFDHLRPEHVAAYVDRAVDGDDRVKIEEHLAECATCCEEVVAVSRLQREPVRMRKGWLIGASAAAAAVLTLILVNEVWREAPHQDFPPVQRSPDAMASIRVISPPDGAIVLGEEVSFSWSAIGDDSALYHFVLTTEDADSVWAVTTPGPAVTLPSDAPLRPGTTYLWYVDALMADGRTFTTGLHSFQTQE